MSIASQRVIDATCDGNNTTVKFDGPLCMSKGDRLRKYAEHCLLNFDSKVIREAADEIDRLEREVATLRLFGNGAVFVGGQSNVSGMTKK